MSLPPQLTCSSLVDWPEELLTEVFTHQEDTDALAFRATSRNIAEKLLFNFKTRFFKTRKYDFSRTELDRLLAVSNNDRFAPAIERLELSLERWKHDDLHAKLYTITTADKGKGIHHPFRRELDPRWRQARKLRDDGLSPEEREQQAAEVITKRVEAFNKEMHERVQLLETGESDQLLLAAMSKLINLNSLVVRVQDKYHCWDVSGALDGARCGNIGTLRKSWVTLGTEFGGVQRLQLVEKHQLFSQLTSVLARTEPLRYLTTLDICMASYEFSEKPGAVPTYLTSQLSFLKITFVGSSNDLRDIRGRDGQEEGTGLSETKQSKDWFVNWVNECRVLKKLVIAFNDYSMGWSVSEFADAVKLPTLEHFGLSGYLLDFRSERIYNRLMTFLTAHRQSLRSLDLADIKLGQDGAGGPYHYCKDLLEMLASLEQLNKISFCRWCEKPQWPGNEEDVRFDKEDIENTGRGNVWSFEGSRDDVQAKLLQLSMSPLYG